MARRAKPRGPAAEFGAAAFYHEGLALQEVTGTSASMNISTSPVVVPGLSYSVFTAAAAAMFIVFLLIRRYQKLV